MKYPKGTTEHPLNKGKKQEILVSVWDFGATHPQSERGYYVCNDHPAKMRPSLARAVLQVYGESPVLDPMAGIGTTLVEAMFLGMDAVGVEYEEKFVDQSNKNIEYVQSSYHDKKLGRAVCLKGDARDLSFLNEKLGSVFFSPPYFDALSLNKGGGSRNSILHEETTQALQMKRSGPFAVKKNLPTPYSSKEENIGNQKEYGIFGSVIFSPPYMNCMKGYNRKRGLERVQKFIQKNPEKARALKKTGTWYNINLIENYPSPNNIGNLDCKTYLGEMLKVYRECYRVLKPGKFMVVVVKDIQRNWKTVPLGADTIKLCQLAGFDCHDVIINKMYFPSFWMLSLAKNSQREEVKRTERFHALKSHEYILVLRKPLQNTKNPRAGAFGTI